MSFSSDGREATLNNVEKVKKKKKKEKEYKIANVINFQVLVSNRTKLCIMLFAINNIQNSLFIRSFTYSVWYSALVWIQ